LVANPSAREKITAAEKQCATWSDISGLLIPARLHIKEKRAIALSDSKEEGDHMKRTVDINLIRNSSAGYSEEAIRHQVVELRDKDLVLIMSADGKLSPASQPARIRWIGASAMQLENSPRVKIKDTDTGELLMEGDICLRNIAPRNVADGVEFEIF
jgi:hypothetical protein